MSLHGALYDYLEAEIDGLGYMGPLPLPQSPSLPALTITQISAPRAYTMDSREVGLIDERTQIDVWGSSLASVNTVKGAVIDLLSGYKGALGGVVIEASIVNNEFPRGIEPETGLRGHIIDMTISWRA
ncbi:MAG: hypothetical protein H6637_05460 [Ardenticatenales bacterium]|nr:hypothetical protein [Ardenticatenales bacterium]